VRALNTDGTFNALNTNIYNSALMRIDEDLWFTFDAESITSEDSFLFTATATYESSTVDLVLLIDCDKPLNSINLVFEDANGN